MAAAAAASQLLWLSARWQQWVSCCLPATPAVVFVHHRSSVALVERACRVERLKHKQTTSKKPVSQTFRANYSWPFFAETCYNVNTTINMQYCHMATCLALMQC